LEGGKKGGKDSGVLIQKEPHKGKGALEKGIKKGLKKVDQKV